MSIATPALAQEASADFTGPRAEIFAGYDTVNENNSGSDVASGLLYGAAIGYDRQLGGIVLGAEAEISGSTASLRNGTLFAPGVATRSEAGRDLYVGLRAGIVATPDLLVYAKGGYTNAQVKNTYDVTIAVPGMEPVERVNLEGFRLGAGAELKLTSRIYAKAEYRYSNYGKYQQAVIDTDRHQLVAGVGVRF